MAKKTRILFNLVSRVGTGSNYLGSKNRKYAFLLIQQNPLQTSPQETRPSAQPARYLRREETHLRKEALIKLAWPSALPSLAYLKLFLLIAALLLLVQTLSKHRNPLLVGQVPQLVLFVFEAGLDRFVGLQTTVSSLSYLVLKASISVFLGAVQL